MSIEQFLLTIQFKKKLHQVIVESKNEAGARLRVLVEFKDAVILSASKIDDKEHFQLWKKMSAVEIPHFLLKENIESI